MHQRDPPTGAQPGSRPAGPKAVHAQTTGDPRGHIQRWLEPGAGTGRYPRDLGPPSLGGPARGHLGSPSPPAGDSESPRSRPGRVPAAPGSSTDPPRGNPPGGTQGPRPSGPSPAAADPGWGGRDSAAQGGTQCGAMGRHASGGTAHPLPGLGPGSDDEDFLPPLSVIPDFFVPFPRRGGPLAPPRPGRRTGGQLEPD